MQRHLFSQFCRTFFRPFILLFFFPLLYAQTSSRFPLYSPAPYKLSWDINMSPYAGGEDILLANRILERTEIFFTSRGQIAYSKAPQAVLWRLSELLAVWLPINSFAVVLQHEVFGHGYRIRDINHGRAQVTGYSFDAPVPYGSSGGSTSYTASANLTTTQESAIAIAGVESTAILAQITKLKWLSSSKVDPRQSILYILGEQDLSLYIDSLKIKNQDFSGHDIHSYLQTLNYTYPDNILSKGRLRSLALLSLADPFTFYAAYSWFRYLFTGKETHIPLIASRYLPNLRLGLTPFGPEVFFENYLLLNKKPLYAYLKGGHHAQNGYYGLGLLAPNLITSAPFSFGLRLDLWRQPKLLLNPASISLLNLNLNTPPTTENPLYPYSQRHAMRYGAAASLIFAWNPQNKGGLESELGYKSQGFLPGYSLKAFPTVRLAAFFLF